jgi:hypothetical protein
MGRFANAVVLAGALFQGVVAQGTCILLDGVSKGHGQS